MSEETSQAVEGVTLSDAADGKPAPLPNATEIQSTPSPQRVPVATAEAPSTLIKHKPCGKTTDIGAAMAKSHRDNPGLFMTLPCHWCNGNLPVKQFTWDDGSKFAESKIVERARL